MSRLHIRTSAICAAALFLGACAGTAPGSTAALEAPSRYFSIRDDAPRVRATVLHPVDRVREALPAAFTDLGYAGGRAANSREIFITPYLRITSRLYPDSRNSEYFDCGRRAGGGERADSHSITFALLARATPAATGGTNVEILVDGSAVPHAANVDAVPCTGTGKLENALLLALQARLAQS